MKNKILNLVLVAICAVFTLTLCSCNMDDNTLTGRAGDAIDDMEYDVNDGYDDGMGNNDIYDMGTSDDNGVNTNEGSADGGMRTDTDNGGLLFDDGADAVVNY